MQDPRQDVDASEMQAPARHEELCPDCPPVGYPTDVTRCRPCPRRGPPHHNDPGQGPTP